MSRLLYFYGVVALVLMLSACASQPASVPNLTMQPIELASNLRPGMTEGEVTSIMGRPIARDFEGKGSALQWCKTAVTTLYPLDRFVIGFFYNDKLVGVRNYTGGQGQYGDCAMFYKAVEWRPSDTVIEYRFR